MVVDHVKKTLVEEKETNFNTIVNKASVNISRIARILAKDNDAIIFSTIGLEGSPRSRYIGAFRVRDNAEFLLISPSDSNKIKEIQKNPQVQILLASRDHRRVLTLSGHAHVVTDVDVRRALYDEKKLQIYPVFNDYFGVIRFIPVRAEFLDLKVSNTAVTIAIDAGKIAEGG